MKCWSTELSPGPGISDVLSGDPWSLSPVFTPAIVLDLDTGDNSSARAEQIEQQIGGGVCPTAGVRVTLHTLSLGHCAATVLGWGAMLTRCRQNICTAR